MMCTNVPQFCTYVQLGFRGGTDQAEIAPRADLRRGAGLEVLAKDSLSDLYHDALHAFEVVRRPADRDLLVREHVPVAAGRPLQSPGLTGGETVDRQLHVGLQGAGRLRIARLVVDQLVAAARELVDPVDAAAEMMWPDPEVELPLDPAGLRPARHLAGVVAVKRLDRLLAELELVVGLAEARAPPGDPEEAHQPLEAAGMGIVPGLLAVKALQHLVDDDSEPLIDRRLLRDAEDASELVLEGTRAVELDVGGRERQALAATRQERFEGRLVALGDQLPATLGRSLLVEEIGIEPGVAEGGALVGRDRLLEQVVHHRERVGDRLLARALDQAGQLDELEKARDGPIDVHVGVQPRFAQLAARTPG